MSQPVFLDSSGKRSTIVKRIVITSLLIMTIVTACFARNIFTLPFLPRLSRIVETSHHFRATDFPFLPPRQKQLERFLLHRSRLELWREIARTTNVTSGANTVGVTSINAARLSLSRLTSSRASLVRASPSSTRSAVLAPANAISANAISANDVAPKPVAAAFYATWQGTGLNSLRANAAHLTHLMPEWLHLKPDGVGLDFTDWNPKVTTRNPEVVSIARANKLQVQPILNNAFKGAFDSARASLLLNSVPKQNALSIVVRDWLLRQHFNGLNLDLENLLPQDKALLPAFVARLDGYLSASGLSLSVDVEAGDVDWVGWKTVASSCDFLILMAYNEHAATSAEPGAIASANWSYQVLQRLEASVPPSKVVVGIGNYAYDWTRDKAPSHTAAHTLTYQDALALARDYRSDTAPDKAVDFDPDALQTTFEYSDDAGRAHEVWMLDGVTAYNQWLMARRTETRGAALWVLGSEDPSLWSFFDATKFAHSPSPSGLKTIHFPIEVSFQGRGEVLSVHSSPVAGRRRITVDKINGLCTDMEYEKFPSPFVIKRRGYHQKQLALTFDDGPQAGTTEQILQVLRDEKVPGTFFMIGENAQRYPDLVRRVYGEGHEIGSHTFTHPNLGKVSVRREVLELNTTQRALQSILGHSTILFRPPYNADAEPNTEEEVRPIVLASQMGYVTIGELIDPQDWNTFETDARHNVLPRTPQDVARSIFRQVRQGSGNIVLLHDGGGDRTNTIAALRLVIPQLKAQGYRFVPVSSLVGSTRAQVMPLPNAHDLALAGFDRYIFNGVYGFETALRYLFLLAIALGLLRMTSVLPLALFALRRDRARSAHIINDDDLPLVSVLVAAYNEANVIVRTIESILQSEYSKPIEVVVVDDGSQDDTAREVETNFANEPRVRLLRQKNGGKSRALNNAIGVASGDVLVCFDADTQIAPDAVAKLARHFIDPEVGAVAGNIKVGNRLNLLTNWQSIEYITSQNLDRRAYSLLNAITVVPGAIGAWRREAVLQVGGYTSDTLAEDMDLTWRIRRAGWRLETDSEAIAWTEAPDSVNNLFKQRFRWSYGSLQCLWKHRDAVGHYGWFGCLALPMLWIFQFLLQIIAPIIDLQILYLIFNVIDSAITGVVLRQDWQPLPQARHDLSVLLGFYLIFFVAEIINALVAFRLDRENPKVLFSLFWQRLVYRQLMYVVVWQAMWKALHGLPQGWGKLQRKGTVSTPQTPRSATPLG